MVAVTRARERLPITLEISEVRGEACVSAICYHRPDERDVSDRQETNQDGATDDPGVPGVVPVQERVPLS